jgi:hypothetical protein
VKVVVGNFQGTYVRFGNSWDLRSCHQKPDETLHEYIRRFSWQCTELPNVTDVDVIGAFLVGTTRKELVHKLGCKGPRTTRELLDIATNFASSEEVVGAIFHDTKGKEKQQENTNEGGSSRNSKKKKKAKQSRKDPLVAAAERNNPWAPPEGGPGVFDKMLDKPCPYHQGPVKHTLKECGMMKCYFFGGAQGKGDLARGPRTTRAMAGRKTTTSLSSTTAS